nr:EOG090X0DPU [Chydorus sphaericus]
MKAQLIMESKGVEFKVIDIADPGCEADRLFMQKNAPAKNGARNSVPPQFFNDEEYCGDYEGFDDANENDALEEFLKLPRGSLPQVPVINHNLSNLSSRDVSLEKEVAQLNGTNNSLILEEEVAFNGYQSEPAGHDVFKNDVEDDIRDPQGVDDIVENHDYPEEAEDIADYNQEHHNVEDAPMDAVAPEDSDEYEEDEEEKPTQGLRDDIQPITDSNNYEEEEENPTPTGGEQDQIDGALKPNTDSNNSEDEEEESPTLREQGLTYDTQPIANSNNYEEEEEENPSGGEHGFEDSIQPVAESNNYEDEEENPLNGEQDQTYESQPTANSNSYVEEEDNPSGEEQKQADVEMSDEEEEEARPVTSGLKTETQPSNDPVPVPSGF